MELKQYKVTVQITLDMRADSDDEAKKLLMRWNGESSILGGHYALRWLDRTVEVVKIEEV